MKGTHQPVAATYDQQNFVFIGKPHKGDIDNLPLSLGNWYQIGNPYPSALDAYQFIDDNEGVITGDIEIWDDWEDNTHYFNEAHAGYAILNKSDAIPAANYNDPGKEGGKTPKRYIGVAQGFGVTGVAPAEDNKKIIFRNAQRSYVTENSGESIFFKSSGKNQHTSSQAKDKRLKIRLGFRAYSNFNRQILLTIDENATDGIDYGYDAVVSSVYPDDLYWVVGADKLLIQAVKDLTKERVVPLGINSKGKGLLEIKIDKIENPYPNMEVYLRDNLTMDTYDIVNGSFEINLEAGEHNDKYSLVFEPKPEITLELEEEIEKVNEELVTYISEDNSLIKIKRPDELIIERISLFNIIGQQLQVWTSIVDSDEIALPINVRTGAYIIIMETNKGKILRKVIIE